MDAYDKNNHLAGCSAGIEIYIEYPPLLDDIDTAKHCVLRDLKNGIY